MDKRELSGALWAICSSLGWVEQVAAETNMPDVCREAGAIADAVWALADKLVQEEG